MSERLFRALSREEVINAFVNKSEARRLQEAKRNQVELLSI